MFAKSSMPVWALVCLACALFTRSANAQYSMTFANFTGVVNALPIPGSIELSADGKTYSLNVTAPADFIANLQVQLQGSNLSIGLKTGYTYTGSLTGASFIVSTPAGALDSIEAPGAGLLNITGACTDTAGVSITAPGAGTVLANDLNVTQLDISLPGASQLITSGTIASASLNVPGAGSIYLSQVTKSVDVLLVGAATVEIDAASDAVTITGTQIGVGSVTYNQGSCNLGSIGGSLGGLGSFASLGSIGGASCTKGTVTPPALSGN